MAEQEENKQNTEEVSESTPVTPEPEAETTTEEQVSEETSEPTSSEASNEAVPKKEKLVPGMVVRVHQKIKETTPKGDERERVQVFEGTILAVKGKDAKSRTVTVRKVSGGIGVERIFPVTSPAIANFEIVKQFKTRQSKLYYLRTHKKKLKEKTVK